MFWVMANTIAVRLTCYQLQVYLKFTLKIKQHKYGEEGRK